jgi:hypothetical protein
MIVFSNVARCSKVDVDRRFRGTYCLPHHGGNTNMGDALTCGVRATLAPLNVVSYNYIW